MRTALKEQIKEKIQFDKTERGRKNLECQSIIEKDRQDLEQYKQKQQQRAKYLLQFTTKNKEVRERATQLGFFSLFFLLVNGK